MPGRSKYIDSAPHFIPSLGPKNQQFRPGGRWIKVRVRCRRRRWTNLSWAPNKYLLQPFRVSPISPGHKDVFRFSFHDLHPLRCVIVLIYFRSISNLSLLSVIYSFIYLLYATYCSPGSSLMRPVDDHSQSQDNITGICHIWE